MGMEMLDNWLHEWKRSDRRKDAEVCGSAFFGRAFVVIYVLPKALCLSLKLR